MGFLSRTHVNLKIDTEAKHVGLFQELDGGEIRHIGVKEADVSSSDYYYRSFAGGLVGRADNATISHSYAYANVSASSYSSFAGGLVGHADHTTISHSYAHANVSASSSSYSSSAGGLVGRADNATISHSYAHTNVSSVSSDSSSAGGLVGRAYYNTNISHSYALSDRITAVSEKGHSYIGGLIGQLQRNSNLSRSYYDISRAGVADAVGSLKNGDGKVTSTVSDASGQSTAQMQKQSTYQGWDFDKVWRIAEGTYPRLRSLTEGVITINPNPTKPDIQAKANDLSKTYDGEALTVTNPNDPNAPLRNLKGWGNNGITINGLKDGDTLSENDLKALRFDGKGSNWLGAVNAGNYTLVPWGLDLQKYEVRYGNGTLTIHPKPITVLGKRQYDGTRQIDAKDMRTDIGDLVAADRQKITGGAADWQKNGFAVAGTGWVDSADANVGPLKYYDLSNAPDLTLKSKSALPWNGILPSNYVITKGQITIDPKDMVVKALNNIRPEGGANPPKGHIGIVAKGLVGSDRIADVDIEFNKEKIPGEYQGKEESITPSNAKFGVGKASNYKIDYQPGKLLLVQQDYELNDDRFGDHQHARETIRGYAAALKPFEDELYLAEAVYGNDKARPNAPDRFYDVYRITDKKTGFTKTEKVNWGTEPGSYQEDKNNPDKEIEVFKVVTRSVQGKQQPVVVDIVGTPVDGYPDGLYEEGKANGLNAALYKRVGKNMWDTGGYFIVFRGTDTPIPGPDGIDISQWRRENHGVKDANWGTNVAQGFGYLPGQYREALNFTRQQLEYLKRKGVSMDKVTLVGHSLGGGLASYVSANLNEPIRTVTFNPAPTHILNVGNKEEREQFNKIDNDKVGTAISVTVGVISGVISGAIGGAIGGATGGPGGVVSGGVIVNTMKNVTLFRECCTYFY